jgi:hypothetical protein
VKDGDLFVVVPRDAFEPVFDKLHSVRKIASAERSIDVRSQLDKSCHLESSLDVSLRRDILLVRFAGFSKMSLPIFAEHIKVVRRDRISEDELHHTICVLERRWSVERFELLLRGSLSLAMHELAKVLTGSLRELIDQVLVFDWIKSECH